MIRFILKRNIKIETNGATYDIFETYDLDHSDLELKLFGGGYSEGGYDIVQLVGVEQVRDEQ